MQIASVNEWSNKVVLAVATAIGGIVLSGSLAILGRGLQAYADGQYMPRREAIDTQLVLVDYFIEEKEAIFMQVADLDPLTAKRIGRDKGRWENYKYHLLRQREDLAR